MERKLNGRAVNALLASVGLVLAAVPMALIGTAVLFFLGRPVLFRQKRVGLNGISFELIKFRSMHDLRDASGQPLPNELRTPAFGRLLRRSRLDELPELWNILRGDMAIVGPRPLLPGTIAALGAEGQRRCRVRPGITGLAQVSGNTLLSIEEKVAMDLLYVREHGLAMDLRILIQTPLTMLKGEKVDAAILERAHAGGHHWER